MESATDDLVNDYEKRRLANIRRNELELRRLGLDISAVTRPAKGITYLYLPDIFFTPPALVFSGNASEY